MVDREEKKVKDSTVRRIDTKKTVENEVIEPRRVLYKWTSDQRAFRRLKKRQYLTVLASVVIFMVVLAILGHYWFIAALAALMFLLYAVGTVPPVKVTHVITNHGIETNDMKYGWEKVRLYWFGKRNDQKYLNIETSISFPGRLIMLVDDEQLVNIHKILENRLEYSDLRGQSWLSVLLDGKWINMVEGSSEKEGGNGSAGKLNNSVGK